MHEELLEASPAPPFVPSDTNERRFALGVNDRRFDGYLQASAAGQDSVRADESQRAASAAASNQLLQSPARTTEIDRSKSKASDNDEVNAAWAIFTFNWRFLASVTGALCAILMASRFYIDPTGYLVAFAVAALYWGFGLRNAGSTRANPKIFVCLAAMGQMFLAIPVLLTLTYVAVALDRPLQDAALLAWDRALGFDFLRFLAFINHHPRVIPILAKAYTSIHVQMLAVMLVLPIAGLYRRTAEAVCALLIALAATTLISALVPAIGVYGTLGLHPSDFPYFEPQGYYDTLRDAPLLRAGELRELHLLGLVGVLTFPSFHAACAAFNIWAFWPLRWLRPIVIPWNFLMIVATPLGGGHYFVDVLAGILVAAAAIFAARIIGNRPNLAPAGLYRLGDSC